MRLTCQYSKITFSTSAMLSTGVQAPVQCVHPVFYADLEYLSKLYDAWEEGKMKEVRDQRLLFLALLNATDHIDWYCAADPKAETVLQNMEDLFNHVMWMRDIMLPRLSLPRFAVNHSTCKLGNVKVWMETWTEIRSDFEKGYLSRAEEQRKARRQAALDILSERKIKDDTSKTRHLAYLRTLADWAAVALKFPEPLASFWKQIIRCQSARAALDFRPVDVEELLEHVTEFGDYNSTHYFALLKQVKQVLMDAKGESISDLDFSALLSDVEIPDSTASRKLPSTSTEATEIARQVQLAPLDKPKESDYANKTQYMIALARFNLAQSHATKQSSL